MPRPRRGDVYFLSAADGAAGRLPSCATYARGSAAHVHPADRCDARVVILSLMQAYRFASSGIRRLRVFCTDGDGPERIEMRDSEQVCRFGIVTGSSCSPRLVRAYSTHINQPHPTDLLITTALPIPFMASQFILRDTNSIKFK